MLITEPIANQLAEKSFFVEYGSNIKGESFLGVNTHIAPFSHNHICSLSLFDSFFLSSFSGLGHGFYKNVAVGAYGSFAEGVKIVPDVEVSQSQSFTLSPCRNKDVSPIFAKFKNQQTDQSFPYTIIGHDVWLGGNVQVKAGTIIGHGSIIGAGSVVTKHVPPYSIVVGNPARFLRLRFAESMVERLLKSQWYIYDWQHIELPWGELDPCLELMEQHIAKGSVPLLGQGCKLIPNEQGEMSVVFSTEQESVSWTLEEHLQKFFGTSDMAEIFARPEIKENSYQKA